MPDPKTFKTHLIACIPLQLAKQEVWANPAGIALVRHDRHSFNGEPVLNSFELIALDADDMECFDSQEDHFDPGDLTGHSVNLLKQDLRAIAKALTDAADDMDREGLEHG